MRRQRNAYRKALLKLLWKWSSNELTYQDCMDAYEVIVKYNIFK